MRCTFAELRAETRRAIWDYLPSEPAAKMLALRTLEAAIDAEIAAERHRIGERVSQRQILSLQIGVDPLEEVNDIIQDLAHDIETNWADYEDDELDD